ncbi:chromosome partitioning protein ParB [Ameyamaea chiangmaiensis NBRC 103196]|uniref:ParB/RepB/Spo0J family partition protein n=1 Tax=Ameyamaea chiangmaiensis TaxID=442969 RepID=A0A850PEV9_9PROT|nr:ParB/RepB/Spo0J family partition protein [Ameyamaea chiangmaiensis]MBS4074910.1 ParB/RepB/Spo0J family partition protein [Ameyamaea chiangmaiensis]NVN40786.1 ParB/RepB/Spo0J family partition protein [Ameyamaea chiangmaiensis]GBQ63186.1 chromosome partitioning protein ParB [Ameyamaea chiangmaiensis NBRC 103196]
MASKKDAPRPRLGRGLAALLGDDAPKARSAEGVASLPIEFLVPGPFQPRQDMEPGPLSELAESIRVRGILQPILARPDPAQDGRYQIIAGERRWRAAQMAGLHDVPVHVRALDDSDAMAAALVENLQRADLNAIEEAEGLQRLSADYRLTQEELARAVGKSRPHVANMLRLLNLPPPVRTHVRRGELSAGHARALLAHPDPVAAARTVLTQGLNVRQTEALAGKATKPVSTVEKPRDPRSPEIGALERELGLKLGMPVQITFDGKGGSLRILYRSLDQFDSLLARLNR